MIQYLGNNKINAVFVPRNYSDVTLITEHNMQLITEHSFYAKNHILRHPANQLISLHNHPNNQYFSVGDVGVWVKYSQFIDSYIVTNDCKYQACLKKICINNSINAWSLYRRYQMITYENNISMHQDADRILDSLIRESNTNLDYRAIVFQNY